MAIKIFDPIEIWAQCYSAAACDILVAHCELVHKKEVLQGEMTVFEYQLSDRGETLLALADHRVVALLQRQQAQREAEDS
jgi:hypothetical protein